MTLLIPILGIGGLLLGAGVAGFTGAGIGLIVGSFVGAALDVWANP